MEFVGKVERLVNLETPVIQYESVEPSCPRGPRASSARSDSSISSRVALLTGGFDRPYATGLATALTARGVHVDFLGNDETDGPELHSTTRLRFINIWPRRSPAANAKTRARRTLGHYGRMLLYAARSEARVFHILWNSKVQWFDRTLLMLYYKMCGKSVVLTAHNVNQARRDGHDSYMNRVGLRIQYRLCDHLFVHTGKMKEELMDEFGVPAASITLIRHPVNHSFPNTDLTPLQARLRLGLDEDNKVVLCLGRIKPYKGVEHLLTAFRDVVPLDSSFRLIVAGEVQDGYQNYLAALKNMASGDIARHRVSFVTRFIPDNDIEVYLKAADVLVLPYNDIFQSGILFLGYSFGLPVIASDVGAFREEIVDGKTGYICRPRDPVDLANTILKYFGSNLYRNLDTHRQAIMDYAERYHSWSAVADLTQRVYDALLEDQTARLNADPRI